jgi:hypothetical protein
MMLNCTDPKYYPDTATQREIVYIYPPDGTASKQDPAYDKYRRIQYGMEQARPLNPHHMSLFRVFSMDERAPNSLGPFAKQITTKQVLANLDRDGIICYESELITMFNMINSLRNVLNSKTTIKDDVRSLQQIMAEPNYHNDDSKRRSVMALKVAISNKQTVQVGARASSERAADLVHRKVLDELMPSEEASANGFNFKDFDVLYGKLVHELKWL